MTFAAAALECPLCTSTVVWQFLRTDDTPHQIGVVWPTYAEAVAAPAASLELSLCRECGFVFNSGFTPGVEFAPGYDVSLHHSPTYDAYLQAEVLRLVELRGVEEQIVVEIGCGSGHFLRLLCARGRNSGYGFDPSLADEAVSIAGAHSVRLIRGEFGRSHRSLAPGVVVCRSVLELISDPRSFLSDIRGLLSAHRSTLLYFEVPNATWIFNGAHAWNVHHEHFGYYTPDTLTALLASCGYAPIGCDPCYDDGQYLRAEARFFPSAAVPNEMLVKASTHSDQLLEFSRAYDRAVSEWRRRLDSFRESGRSVAVWGVGGRGTAFINAMADNRQAGRDRIGTVVDINPARQDRFVPRTGHQILAPASLCETRPDVLIVTNATYTDEVRAEASALGLACEFLVL